MGRDLQWQRFNCKRVRFYTTQHNNIIPVRTCLPNWSEVVDFSGVFKAILKRSEMIVYLSTCPVDKSFLYITIVL